MKKLILTLTILVALAPSSASAASRFWVGGTGTWDQVTTTHWSATSNGAGGASVPTASDTVTFDASSGGGTITLGANAPVSTFTMGLSTTTLATAGYTFTVTGVLSITGTTARGFNAGSSYIYCGTWTASTVTGLTFTKGTSTITQTGATAFDGGTLSYATTTLTGATPSILAANTFVNLNMIPSSPAKTNTLSFQSGQTITGTFTVSSGTIVTNRVLIQTPTSGNSAIITAAAVAISNADFMDITGAGAATWNLSGISGGSGNCGGNTLKSLGTAAFTTATTSYWAAAYGGLWSGTGATLNWSNSNNGTTTDPGRVPLCQDNVKMGIAYGTSKTVTADMPRLGASIDWTGATWTTGLSLTLNGAYMVNGSLTLISGLTQPNNFGYQFIGRGNYTLTSNGYDFRGDSTISAPTGTLTTVDSTSSSNGGWFIKFGTFSLGNTLTAPSASVSISSGSGPTFNTNNYTVSANSIAFTIPGATVNLGSSIMTISGTGGWTVSNSPTITGTYSIQYTNTSNTAVSFGGGSITYNNVWFNRGASTGNITITGSNTFNDFKDTGTAAHSIRFTDGTTQHFTTFTVSGNSGALITINGSSTGTHTLIKDGGGTVVSDYLNIQHSVASPTISTWYAGLNSINNNSVTTAGSGWIFETRIKATVSNLKIYIGGQTTIL